MSARRLFNKHHGDAPADAVYIGRGSPWGNPYHIGPHGDRGTVIAAFEQNTLPLLDLRPLIGKSLVCYCYPKACHGDIILRELAKLEPTQP
jgi:hypothetical protein